MDTPSAVISEADTLNAAPDTANEAATAPSASAVPRAPTAATHGTNIMALRFQYVRPSAEGVVPSCAALSLMRGVLPVVPCRESRRYKNY